MIATPYPLQWPEGVPRSKSYTKSTFKSSTT